MAQVPAERGTQELLRQQERERALREQQESRPDVRLERDAPTDSGRLPQDEQPCFPVQRILLEGALAGRFDWALKAANPAGDPAIGRCLGTAGVDTVMKRVQNALIARGYVTTRILAAPQDLTTGTLTLTVVPGRIHALRFAERPDAAPALWNALPASPGTLLNLRDIEQGLENLQRVPTATVDIQIAVPESGEAAQPGESDLLVSWAQRSRLRVNLTLDDSGSTATGKLQAGATVSLDNPLRLNDLFYVNGGRSVFNGSGRQTESWSAHYSVPLGYWLLGVNASDYDYRQSVAGAYETYVYSGASRNAEVRLGRMLLRNASAKTSAHARGWYRDSDNFIDDTEIEVQRRRMAGWELGLTHKHFIGDSTLDASVAYRRGTRAFGALPAPEEAFDEGTALGRIFTADAQLTVPFRLGRQSLRYSASWRAQWNRSLLVPQDRFSIGGRYSVRGFDGELTLTGERGWLLRNELGVALGGGQEAYVGADYGHVGGPATQWQMGNALAGVALGLRGGTPHAHWDVFVGSPVHKPVGFPTAYTTFGFSLGASF
ncbi:ShlB/FhaC/HecB family hemolysin secretion/activation protein [Stenotrophomonas mori]|uniref:ShlB/FhaC/HecB family hemolysin secretion/activation protein n=1 Tax=Stenotrophomonas mori TaxID=2871096 RepID=A0ABT0SHI3_9GAMM|nr:ShlB/FhaC/HecB family hemolysin secretion/activation protein [Stenotrophomonas mori]MCL7714455.1 ShlB/FhaC/HecB family hemolysin secretion/activation protein [Stenotrophomonas mori]